MFSNDFKPKFSCKFYCNFCDYGTSKKCNINSHYNSLKHKKSINSKLISNDFQPKLAHTHFCEICNKEYKDYSGLWRHKKKCKSETSIENESNNEDIYDIKTLTSLVLDIVKQNKDLSQKNYDLTNKIVDICKNNSNTISNSTINSNNKTFNLNVFLNETCKDAMNISDFIDSLQLQLSDLEKVGEVGYVEGISNIIIKNLNALDVTLRPVHCTDKKRETMYVKDENKWEKEDDNKSKLHKMVRRISNKNIDLISDFKELYPDWKKSTSRVSDQFNKIVIESMGGSGDNDFEKEEKIIKKVVKEVSIDKSL
jgi:hypothetical protein